MLRVIDIEGYQPLSDDQFLFDTNVWFYIFYPIGNYHKKQQRIYSRFFNSCLRVGSKIYITSLIASEFFNSAIRSEFNNWKIQKENIGVNIFKEHFRKSDEYKHTVKSLVPVIRNQILHSASRVHDNFHQINIDTVFKGIDVSDFNDNYFLSIAEMNGYKIVSDDRDLRMSNRNVVILTLNP